MYVPNRGNVERAFYRVNRWCHLARLPSSPRTLPRWLQHPGPAEVPVQDGWHLDRAVLEVAGLQQRRHRPRQREAGAVQRVQVADLAIRIAVAEVGAPRLEVHEVGDARDLEPLSGAGRPDLDVVGHGRGEREVAGREPKHTVLEAKRPRDGERVVQQLLEGAP